MTSFTIVKETSAVPNQSDRPDLEHPGLYSLWLYRDSENQVHNTMIEVTATSTYGYPEGHVELKWYSLNGSSNNSGYVDHQIPKDIQRLTIVKFWDLVDAGRLVFLQPRPYEHNVHLPILQVGDII